LLLLLLLLLQPATRLVLLQLAAAGMVMPLAMTAPCSFKRIERCTPFRIAPPR
jgi:hypothetical protein